MADREARAPAGAPANEAAPARREESLSRQVKAQIQVPPELREAYERIVLAGMKVMFSEETNRMAMQSLQGEGPIEQRLAKGICDLMALLWQQSNQSMPPQLIIPAAIELLTEAADFIDEAGAETISPQQLGEALRLMIGQVLERFGATEQNVQAALQPQGGAQAGPPQGAAPQGGTQAQGGPPAGGVIGRAMGG
jgi:hypothetical protein